ACISATGRDSLRVFCRWRRRNKSWRPAGRLDGFLRRGSSFGLNSMGEAHFRIDYYLFAGCHRTGKPTAHPIRSEEHTSELQSRENLVCRLLLEKKNKINCKKFTN